MKSLVIGAGQIGTAIYEIIKPFHKSYIRDISDIRESGFEILHICYPEHENFVLNTRAYIDKYSPELTIIHSSVSVGTTDICGEHVVYSPIRGRHPNLVPEIRTYEKFIAGRNEDDVSVAANYFLKCGLNVMVDYNPVNLELMKLLSNIHMGVEIAWRQEVERIIRKYGASSSIYNLWEDSYAQGYKRLGQDHLMRPRMRPDPIGGHCILECTDILSQQYPSKIFEFIQESNDYKKFEVKEKNRRK